MDPAQFPNFKNCLDKHPSWEKLNATKREQVFDACKGAAKAPLPRRAGPTPASVTKRPPPPTSLPQLNTVQASLREVLSQLQDLDSKISNLQDGQRNLQDSIAARETAPPIQPIVQPEQEEEFIE